MRRKKTGISKLLFFIEFYVYMIVYTLQTSAFGEFIPPIVYTLTRFLVIGITIISILLSKSYRVKNFVDTLIIVLCLVGALGNYFIVGFAIPLEFMCLIITAKDIDFEWIINNYIRITLCILIVAFICSSVGMIPTNNIVQNGVMRYSFGMNYCTDFAAHIFYLILADNYIKFKKISFSRIFIYLVAAYVVYKYCAARLDTILILALVALDLYLIINAWVKKRNVEYFKGTRFLKILLIGAYPISSVLSLICAINYRESDFLQIINIALSYRIYYANQALNTYGYPLWGKLFEMVGSGTIAKNQTAGLVYFFVDNSYIYIMLRYGVIFMVALGMLMMNYIYGRLKNNDWILPLMIVLSLISSIIDHHFFSVYNVFIFGYMALIKEWTDRVVPKSLLHITRHRIYLSK